MTEDTLPVGSSDELRYYLLKGIVEKGGIATAEDLRPIVRKQMKLSQQAVIMHDGSYKATISNALIQLANDGMVERPFGNDTSTSNTKLVRWLYRNRSSQKRQVVWQITKQGRDWVTTAEATGGNFARYRRYVTTWTTPSPAQPEPKKQQSHQGGKTTATPKEKIAAGAQLQPYHPDQPEAKLAPSTAKATNAPKVNTAKASHVASDNNATVHRWPENRGVDPETMATLANREERYQASGVFDPKDARDCRERTLAAVVRRRGQPEFRRQLLRIYRGRCVITGSDAEPALEAAHITPYLGPETNHSSNGLLLRADIHTLFDLKLLTIDPKTLIVLLSPALMETSYAELHGRQVALPSVNHGGPSREALAAHYNETGIASRAMLTNRG
ncbi:MAG: hypothetical protein HGA19_22355 [Oscillochloris sp.]|nr:hypothetical protein [Oscillochloris sp.]